MRQTAANRLNQPSYCAATCKNEKQRCIKTLDPVQTAAYHYYFIIFSSDFQLQRLI